MSAYRFAVNSPGWREERKTRLVSALQRELGLATQPTGKKPWVADSGVEESEVVIEDFHLLSEEEQEVLIDMAEDIYRRVMGVGRC